MTRWHTTRWAMGGLVVAACAGAYSTALAGQTFKPGIQAQPPARDPAPPGRRIEAGDGDIVVIEEDVRVRIVRRRHAAVRAVFNPTERWLILLVDYPSTAGGPADGSVDATYSFNELTGDWPLGERWEGDAIVEDYSAAGEIGFRGGVGLVVPQGLVQFLGFQSNEQPVKDPAAVAVMSFRGSSRGGGDGASFDEAEQRQVDQAKRNAALRARLPGGTGSVGLSGGVASGVVEGFVTSGAVTQSADGGAVRVGGNIVAPRKIFDVPPTYPETARQARVFGVVILELTIGPYGTVTDARVLRSIPLLDAAAIEAARQWRYQPPLLNGEPIAVIMTATVNFAP